MSTPLELPSLTAHPITHPFSGLSLSTTFLSFLASYFPSSNTRVLSIGSGSGLLEALLQSSHPNLEVVGVEVQNSSGSPNKYLPSEAVYLVKGTWDIYPYAADAEAWMFVYPRSPRLLDMYLDEIESRESSQRARKLDCLVWAGPRVDWIGFEGCFERPWLRLVVLGTGSDCGLMEYELCAIFTR